MKKDAWKRNLGFGLAALVILASLAAARGKGKDAIGAGQRISPKALAGLLAAAPAAQRPLLLQVGFQMLYRQAHIPGSVYAGPGRSPEGLALEAAALKGRPKDQPIVLYCGCCPWSHCPNVLPAFKEAQTLGFKDVKVLVIDQDFGRDWADLGYPVASGD